jgi:hypothetical protein
MGDEDNCFEIVCSEKINILIKEGPLSFVLFESPFTSVPTSTVSRGHPSLAFLVICERIKIFLGLKLLQNFLLFRSSSPFPSKISVLQSSLLSYVQ